MACRLTYACCLSGEVKIQSVNLGSAQNDRCLTGREGLQRSERCFYMLRNLVVDIAGVEAFDCEKSFGELTVKTTGRKVEIVQRATGVLPLCDYVPGARMTINWGAVLRWFSKLTQRLGAVACARSNQGRRLGRCFVHGETISYH